MVLKATEILKQRFSETPNASLSRNVEFEFYLLLSTDSLVPFPKKSLQFDPEAVTQCS